MCSMGRGSGRRATDRASVPVTTLLREALAHPRQFGLTKGTSVAASLVELAERGATVGRRETFEQVELRVYAAYEADPERQASANAMQRATLESGAV